MNTHYIQDIHLPPAWLAKMLNDDNWKAKMQKHLKNRRNRNA